MNPDLSDEENIEILMQFHGVSEKEARFILAMENGELPGDIIEIKRELNDAVDYADDSNIKQITRSSEYKEVSQLFSSIGPYQFFRAIEVFAYEQHRNLAKTNGDLKTWPVGMRRSHWFTIMAVARFLRQGPGADFYQYGSGIESMDKADIEK
jgi:hypothetical protein